MRENELKCSKGQNLLQKHVNQSFQHFHVLIYFGDVVEHENDEFQEHKASYSKTKEKKNLII